MKRVHLIFFALVVTFALFLLVKGSTTNNPASPETIALPSFEVTALTLETTLIITAESSTTEASTTEVITEYTTEEVEGYKEVPWGSNFASFKLIKNFSGSLGAASAAFVGSTDDNDIALLLNTPVSNRVMFEFVPRKFSSVYFEPDDTWYVFYDGKFSLAFSTINANNFALYRDACYKKYKKIGSFSKKYSPAAKKTCQLEAVIFEKGNTIAFLIKNTITDGKKGFVSAKLLFAEKTLLAAIRSEIKNKAAEKEKQDLHKDLNKIE